MADENDRSQWWIERPDSNLIGHALGEAYEAFDVAYHRSDTAADLRRNAKAVVAALTEVLRLTEDAQCGCYACIGNEPAAPGSWVTVGLSRMIVCSECGNKRCPHATDHRLDCTGSNDAGQDGSRYGGGPSENRTPPGESSET